MDEVVKVTGLQRGVLTVVNKREQAVAGSSGTLRVLQQRNGED